MSNYKLSYSEVVPDQTVVEKWKEITLNTGGRQSTLQDIKVAERSNGYCYNDATKPITRNRFIYWRISHDILELTEQSLDINLSENSIRYKFVDTPILDGITIHETHNNVIILVPTVCSIHKLVFTHPNKTHRQDEYYGFHVELELPSIFSDASVAQAKNPVSFHVITNPSGAGSHLPHCATSWYSAAKDEAYFLYAYPSGDVLLIKHHDNGDCEIVELVAESIVPRFLYGLADKFRSKSNDANVVVSMVLHTIGLETYAMTLSKCGHLRVWSCTKGQSIYFTDILADTVLTHNLSHGSQSHMLKKAVGGTELDFLLVVVLNFSQDYQFQILEPSISGHQFHLSKINTLYSPGVDLIDFSFTISRIWSVWRGEDGECSVFTAPLLMDNKKGLHWVPVNLEPPPDPSEIEEDPNLDPKEVYLQYIFHPGRFSLNIISKALSIYRKSSAIGDIQLSANVLKQQVSIAVDTEIQAELQESEVSDEEYLECANWCWSRFYSCCIQYHVAGLRPLGILLLPSVSGAVLLKKSTYSFLRSMDALEHLYTCSEYVAPQIYPQLGISHQETEDLIKLIEVLAYLDQQLNESFKQAFENGMMQLQSPKDVMRDLIGEIMLIDKDEFSFSILEKLKDCQDVYNAMHKLLELLAIQQLVTDDEKQSPRLQSSINHLFSSGLGISFVSQCLRQHVVTRYSICRNLLALQSIILHVEDKHLPYLEGLRSICMPDTVLLIQAYYNIKWLTGLPVQTIVALEQSLQKLVALKLPPVYNLKLSSNVLLMDLFVGSTGGSIAHKLMLKLDIDEEQLPHWNFSLLTYLEKILSIMWPVNGDVTFAEWLLSSGQHIWLQQYVRFLINWCNHKSRNFLLASSFLTSGEHDKAYDLFLSSLEGVYTEQYLMNQVTNIAADNTNLAVRYILKVIKLFEAYGARNFAIMLGESALSTIERDNPLRATLYSIQFKHHLGLGHYECAYEALQSNPDKERKKDNLRDLVKTLLDKRELDILMSFNYHEMEQLFCSILFTRARATDTVQNIYYDFLYSYQMKRGDPYLRLAAAIMYEQAFRLNNHSTVEALEKQVKCYLASVNAFSLCDPRFAWALKPVEPEFQSQEMISPTIAGSNTEYETIKWSKQVEVIDKEMVRKELALAVARLRLAKIDKNSLMSYTTPQELVVLLSCAGVFKTALEICKIFDVSNKAVFEILTQQCIYLDEEDDQEAWNWLTENDLHDLDVIGNSTSDVAWQLLKTFLFQYEEENMTTIHRYVAEKMLGMACFLPHWLLASYKLRNAAELLRLYYFQGYLIEAANLACEHILAVLDYGCEYFGYKNPLVPGSKPFCLPVNVIESLLHEMVLQNENDVSKPLEKEHAHLYELYVKYLEVSTRISQDTCRLVV